MKQRPTMLPSRRSVSRAIPRLLIPLLLIGLLLSLSGCAESEEISFGAILPLTGAGSIPDVQRGIELAVREVNESGGIAGVPITLHVEDSEGDRDVATEKMNSLEGEHEPLLFFSALSSVTKAVSPIAEDQEIPLIGLVATDPSIPRGKEWTYVFYPSAEHETEPILRILLDQQARSVGVVHFDDAYGRSVAEELQRRAEGTAVTVDTAPYTGQQEELDEATGAYTEYDAVYLVGFASHILRMHAAFAASPYEGLIMSTSTATIPSLRRENDLSGVYVAAPLLYNTSFVLAREVADRYEEAYDRELSHYAATGYDIVKIVTGLLDGEDTERKDVIETLEEGFIYPGVFGEIILHAGDNNIYFPLHPAQIEGEDLRYIR